MSFGTKKKEGVGSEISKGVGNLQVAEEEGNILLLGNPETMRNGLSSKCSCLESSCLILS